MKPTPQIVEAVIRDSERRIREKGNGIAPIEVRTAPGGKLPKPKPPTRKPAKGEYREG